MGPPLNLYKKTASGPSIRPTPAYIFPQNSTSPVLFHIFHQPPLNLYKKHQRSKYSTDPRLHFYPKIQFHLSFFIYFTNPCLTFTKKTRAVQVLYRPPPTF